MSDRLQTYCQVLVRYEILKVVNGTTKLKGWNIFTLETSVHGLFDVDQLRAEFELLPNYDPLTDFLDVLSVQKI